MHNSLQPGDSVQVVQSKLDRSVYRQLQTEVMATLPGLLVLLRKPGSRVDQPAGAWVSTDYSVAYYWFDRWFDLHEFYHGDGTFFGFYSNIQQPPQLNGQVLRVVDLDLDLWIDPDLTWRVVDQDELESNRIRLGYPEDLLARIFQARDEVQELIRRVEFPIRRIRAPFGQEEAYLRSTFASWPAVE